MSQKYKSFSLLKEKQKELNKSLKGKKRIYLDMNFLIEFLKHLNNLQCRPFTKELYELLLHLVKEDRIIIPISDIHLYESYKNPDQYRYESFITLIEKLSQNICFISFDQRWNNELVFCLRLIFGFSDPHSFLNNELWTRPIFLKGDRIPSFDNIPIKKEEDIQKLQESFIEFSWKKTFNDTFAALRKETREELNPKEYEKRITKFLVEGRKNNSNDYTDFTDLLSKEIWGSLEISQEYFNSLLTEFFDDYEHGKSIVADSFYRIKEDERGIRLMYLITESIIKSKEYGVFPALSVGSCLHSLKRWEKDSNYKETDSFDIMHAKVALPYCEYFFTDRNLTGLIKDNHLKLDRVFDCTVLYDLEEAYETLLAEFKTNDT